MRPVLQPGRSPVTSQTRLSTSPVSTRHTKKLPMHAMLSRTELYSCIVTIRKSQEPTQLSLHMWVSPKLTELDEVLLTGALLDVSLFLSGWDSYSRSPPRTSNSGSSPSSESGTGGGGSLYIHGCSRLAWVLASVFAIMGRSSKVALTAQQDLGSQTATPFLCPRRSCSPASAAPVPRPVRQSPRSKWRSCLHRLPA